MKFLDYIIQNIKEIIGFTMQHLELTLVSVFIAILISVPLGIFITYVKKLNKPILGLANIVQAIPSLALLGFLIPVLGIGTLPAIFMVVIYSLLPIIKNTSTGLNNISQEIIEAAKGIGMTKMQVLFKVKLPLALPVIMAGVRISAVTAVGLVTISAFIGAGGLGYLVYSGIRTVNTYQILSGAIPACIMALFIDFFVALVEKAVTPISFTQKVQSSDANTIKKFNNRRKITLTIASLAIISVFVFSISSRISKDEKKIIIAAKDFTEQNIMANIYAELIERNSDITVERNLDLGGTQIVFTAMKNGFADMYVEYTGTVYGNILGYKETKPSDEIYEIVVNELMENYNLQMLAPIGFNNTYAIAVSEDTRKKYDLKTISDLAVVSNQLIAAPSLEFMNRGDGLPGLKKAYNMSFKEEIAIDGIPRYSAIKNNNAQVTDAFSTDGVLIDFNLTILEDDKNFFPPYYSAPIVRPEIIAKYPELTPIIDKLTGQISDDDIRELNHKVDILKQNPRDVAIEFLKERKLIEE